MHLLHCYSSFLLTYRLNHEGAPSPESTPWDVATGPDMPPCKPNNARWKQDPCVTAVAHNQKPSYRSRGSRLERMQPPLHLAALK